MLNNIIKPYLIKSYLIISHTYIHEICSSNFLPFCSPSGVSRRSITHSCKFMYKISFMGNSRSPFFIVEKHFWWLFFLVALVCGPPARCGAISARDFCCLELLGKGLQGPLIAGAQISEWIIIKMDIVLNTFWRPGIFLKIKSAHLRL